MYAHVSSVVELADATHALSRLAFQTRPSAIGLSFHSNRCFPLRPKLVQNFACLIIVSSTKPRVSTSLIGTPGGFSLAQEPRSRHCRSRQWKKRRMQEGHSRNTPHAHSRRSRRQSQSVEHEHTNGRVDVGCAAKRVAAARAARRRNCEKYHVNLCSSLAVSGSMSRTPLAKTVSQVVVISPAA